MAQSVAPVSIHLTSEAVVETPVVYLHQVASLGDGSPRFREFIAPIDLADTPTNGKTITISRQQIRIRLLLAGLDESRFTFSGSASVRVRARGTAPPNPLGKIQTANYQDLPPPPAEKVLMVRAREPVQVFTKLSSVTLSVQGEALQDGRVGQTIRVKNALTKQIVIGRVCEDGRIEVSR